MSIEEKIKKLLKERNRFMVGRIDLGNAIYVYSKEHEDQKWTGPPLYISKKPESMCFYILQML
jgi:hypothetical protein